MHPTVGHLTVSGDSERDSWVDRQLVTLRSAATNNQCSGVVGDCIKNTVVSDLFQVTSEHCPIFSASICWNFLTNSFQMKDEKYESK